MVSAKRGGNNQISSDPMIHCAQEAKGGLVTGTGAFAFDISRASVQSR